MLEESGGSLQQSSIRPLILKTTKLLQIQQRQHARVLERTAGTNEIVQRESASD